jgi:hypothetical protein
MPLLLMDNPYRVTKDGFDWEAIEEHDPWSYIGYWRSSDHLFT